jgi:hypothetical protein
MKSRVLLVGLAVALLSVSAAVAAPPEGKGKPKTGEGCKPKVTVVLKGTLNSVSGSSLSMKVARANHWGQTWAKAGSASVTLDQKTKVRGHGMKSVADLAKLASGDRVLVQARVCKADLAEGAAPALTATRVVGHPANPAKDATDDDANENDDD